jgi:CelD/BcsL family acetyltransferase involved in cellulose biosynthesis
LGTDGGAPELTMQAGLPDLDLCWIETVEALTPLYSEWQALAARVGADVYMFPDWFAPWWVHFGAGRTPRVLVARRGVVLVALLPFCTETIWAGPWPMRIARLAGTDPHCMVFTLPIEPAEMGEVLQRAMGDLLGPYGCAAVSFTPVSDVADHLPILQAMPQRSNLRVTDLPDGSHVMFPLPDSFDAFLATRLSKKRRSQFRRDLSGLETRFGMTSARSVPDAAAFAQFVAFHNQQWQAIGYGGHFADWPNSAAFYGAVCAGSDPDHGVGLFEQVGTDGPLATQFALISGTTAHWRLPARSLDPEADHLSVGKVGLVLMIKTLIETGYRRIEAGRGEYDYKLVYGGENVPVHRVVISAAGAFSGLRLRVLLVWVDLMDIGFYKIWFKRLHPRIRKITGGASRPLWRAWIRTRL